MGEFRAMVTTQRPDVLYICETWLQEDPFNDRFYPGECLLLHGYNMYRYDNKRAIKGGIILYIRPELDGGPCKSMIKSSANFEESSWHWIRSNSGEDKQKNELILHGCIYRKGSSTSENNMELYKVLSEACKTNKLVSICGDFNLPSINWKQPLILDNNKSNTAKKFIETLDDLFLIQHVKDWTRKRGNDLPSTLDLVLTDTDQVIQRPVIIKPLGLSDHGVVQWTSTFKVTPQIPPIEEPKHNFFKGNYKQMKKDLANLNWDIEFQDCSDVNDMTTKLEEVILSKIKEYIPLKKKTNNGHQKQAPWINLSSLKAIRRKYHAWKRFQNTKCHQMYLQYVKERRKATKKLRNAKKQFEEKLATECDKNPKAFFNYANSHKKKSTTFIRLQKKFSRKVSEAEMSAEEITHTPPSRNKSQSSNNISEAGISAEEKITYAPPCTEKSNLNTGPGFKDTATPQLICTEESVSEAGMDNTDTVHQSYKKAEKEEHPQYQLTTTDKEKACL